MASALDQLNGVRRPPRHGLLHLVRLVAWKLGMATVLAFWLAYILTRPLGANIGDYLASPHAECRRAEDIDRLRVDPTDGRGGYLASAFS
jgi:hypothetical protein